MIPFVLFVAALPGMVWDQPPSEPVAAFREIKLYAPAANLDAWRQAGVTALDAAQLRDATKLPAPGVRYRVDVASATRAPWIDANGWRIQRAPSKMFYCDAPAGKAALAAAEMFAYGANASIKVAAADLQKFRSMLDFLRRVDAPPLPLKANIGIVDDGTPLVGEIMNLLGRKNILYQPLSAALPGFDFVITLGSKQWPRPTNPQTFIEDVRSKLGDDKRLVRIYGSNVVLARLTGDGSQARLFLLNYSGRVAPSVRVRVLGKYRDAKLAAYGAAALQDTSPVEGGLEFTVVDLDTIAVLDLR